MTACCTVLRVAAAIALFAGALAEYAFAEPRTALVIGNARYSSAPLVNPINDANDVAEALRGAGFDVTLASDADRTAMTEAIRAFGATLKAKGGVGLFFFAGHGLQSGGENYLLPIGDALTAARDLNAKAVSAAEVVEAMASAGNGLNIVVLDACRDNPLTRGGTGGLSRVDTNAHLFVSFSTSPGAVALDGTGRNSPYAKHLIGALKTANLNLEETFKRTLKGVYQETKGQQTPWISSSFFGDFVFRPSAPGIPTALPAAPPKVAPVEVGNLTGVYRVAGVNPNRTRYAGMLTLVQSGDRFALKWWIGRQVFTGTGQLAGRMLVVNWGDKHPVVYRFSDGRILDGEWADGRATETLSLFAKADAALPPSIVPDARYDVLGKNANGGTYRGTLAMTRSGERYDLSWTVGSSQYRGTGSLESNLLVVNWGDATPVVYALGADGSWTGLWAAGAGEETLVPQASSPDTRSGGGSGSIQRN